MKETKTYNPPVSYEKAGKWADSIIKELSLEEKIKLIGGREIFYTEEIPRVNIPKVLFSDATQGIHLRDEFSWNDVTFNYERALDKSVAFPSPILLASTWNKSLSHEYARCIGEECFAGGITVLLGPGMNIYRHSQCGRNFEYFGEDPFLAARMIENYVIGLQKTNTIATLKHFVTNNTDYFRRKSNSIVDERTLHEIYLPAFKAGIDAGAMAVMTSYNLLNGEWCGQSEYVINNLLRKQLGFKWLVMTDWWSVWDGEKVIKSGMDLEMPGRQATENALELVQSGKVTEQHIDRMVHSLLTTIYAMNGFNRKKDQKLADKILPEHEQTALHVAREGNVLLKNRNDILPLNKKKTKNILLTGYFVDKIPEGGGAAFVDGYNKATLLESLTAEFRDKINYIPFPAKEQLKNADVIIFSAGTLDSEGSDRPFDLPGEQESFILECVEANPNTIIIMNAGGGVNMHKWNNKVAAIIYAWYGGQMGNIATAEIISGKINPSGKLPVTIEKKFEDSPGYGYIPKGEQLYTGWNEEEERTRNIYDLKYNEEILVGYRWYDTKQIEPLYPFGYGLSYTSFEYSDLNINKEKINKGDQLKVSFIIKNTGEEDGAEVTQLYISDKESLFPRPLKELKGFEKIFIPKGESKKVTIQLTDTDFSFWHPEKKEWYIEPGKFEILVGSSSRDIRLRKEIVMGNSDQ